MNLATVRPEPRAEARNNAPVALPLAGKTALVTGSTSGIGLAMASALGAQGANVIVNGFGDVDGAVATVKQRSAGSQVGFHAADLARATDIEAMFAYAHQDFGGVDILINNAGIQHVAAIEDFPVERWDAIIALNLTAAFHTTRLVLPGMRARNWGRIINIASVHGLVASTHKAAYVAAKHGLLGFTKVTALETARTGITCNALCPGWVLTPLVQRQVDDRAARDGVPEAQARHDLLLEKQPSGDFVTSEQLAATALFLCSEAANQVRGATWNVDGGWTAQ
ncbi:MAG TPA: 3-hydroxybutyrate dehydrogenase [Kofleriaceae bacterium]|nr:3-hydroxybutyrate dehydrogenase [Kofleriaceae bacterium]